MNKKQLQQIAADIAPATADNASPVDAAQVLDALKSLSGPATRTIRVALDQLVTDPLNFRHEVDYNDKTLQKAILQAGGLLKAPLVTPAGETTADGRPKFLIVGGNRSTYNLREVLKGQGIDADSYQIDAVLREYDGEGKHVQKIMEMVLDNESQQAMSPIDLMHAYQELELSGMSRSDIADKFSKSAAHVSQVLKFSMLPERIQDLMHFESNAARLSAQQDEAFYAENKIPYEREQGGNFRVYGVTYKNAMTMCAVFRRRPAKTAKKSEQAAWDQHVLDVQDFLLREDVLKAAQDMSANTFEMFVVEQARRAGLMEDEAPGPVEPVPVKRAQKAQDALEPGLEGEAVETVNVAPVPSQDATDAPVQLAEVQDAPQAAAEPSTTTAERDEQAPTKATPKAEAKPVPAGLPTGSYAEMLAKGRIELTMDWAEILTDRLKVGDVFAERVVKWMVLNGMLQEV